MLAAVQGDLDAVCLLLERGADVTLARTDDNDTALHLACHKGRTTTVDFLLRKGAKRIVIIYEFS